MVTSQLEGIGFQEGGAKNASAREQAALKSNAIGRGAVSLPGTRQQSGFISNDLANALGGLRQQRVQTELSGEKEQLSLSEQRKQAQDREKQLQNEAANLNMKPAQLAQSLANGLKKLGLDTVMSVNDLMDGMAQNDLRAMAIYNAAVQSATQYASAYGQIRAAR